MKYSKKSLIFFFFIYDLWFFNYYLVVCNAFDVIYNIRIIEIK